jgi:hypothetical protein
MTTNQDSEVQRAWGVPEKYVGTPVDYAGEWGIVQDDLVLGLGRAMNGYAETDACIRAMATAGDADSLAAWRDSEVWASIGAETAESAEAGEEYAADVRAAFDRLIAALPISPSYVD